MQVEVFPKDFLDLIDEILPNLKEKEVFLKSLKETPQKAIRFNPYKIQHLNLPPDSQKVIWSDLAFYPDSLNPSFIDDPLWQAGTFFSDFGSGF